MSSGFTGLIFAAILFAIGLWGRRNADKLVLSTLSPKQQRSKERSMRRGAVMCFVGAAVFLALSVGEFVIFFTKH
jgi:hypothetical protein